MSSPNSFPSGEAVPPASQEVAWGLNACAATLTSWHRTRQIDSMEAQRHRETTYRETNKALIKLVRDAKSANCQIVLTTGEQEIHTFSLRKGEYDFLFREHHSLEPQSELVLERARKTDFDRMQRPEPFEFYAHKNEDVAVGDFHHLVPTSELAKTLSEGGTLEVRELPPPESQE